jgi:uncharacterized protein YodC (DUF2158 family)
MSFNPGDVVRLKSGGPRMVVAEFLSNYGGSAKVYCKWFDINNRIQFDYIPPSALEICNERLD